MDFSKFVLGLRFPIKNENVHDLSVRAWNLIFATLSREEAVEMDLHQTTAYTDDTNSERSLVCVLSNKSLSECRKLYARLAANPALRAEQTIYRPFILSNEAEALTDYVYLGRVSSVGVVENGEQSYGSMRFSGKKLKKGLLGCTPTVVLVATGSCCDTHSAEISIREILRGAADGKIAATCIPFPVSNAASDWVDHLVWMHGGRFAMLPSSEDGLSLRCGILPNRTLVFAVPSSADAKKWLVDAYAQGYRRFHIALDGVLTADEREEILTYVEASEMDASVTLTDPSTPIAMRLEALRFDRYAAQADVIVVFDGAAENLYDEIECRCKASHTKCHRLLPNAVSTQYTENDLRKAAALQFATLF